MTCRIWKRSKDSEAVAGESADTLNDVEYETRHLEESCKIHNSVMELREQEERRNEIENYRKRVPAGSQITIPSGDYIGLQATVVKFREVTHTFRRGDYLPKPHYFDHLLVRIDLMAGEPIFVNLDINEILTIEGERDESTR